MCMSVESAAVEEAGRIIAEARRTNSHQSRRPRKDFIFMQSPFMPNWQGEPVNISELRRTICEGLRRDYSNGDQDVPMGKLIIRAFRDIIHPQTNP